MVIFIGLFQTVRLSKWYLHFDTPSLFFIFSDFFLAEKAVCPGLMGVRPADSRPSMRRLVIGIPAQCIFDFWVV